jgi:hypothetical protein
MGWPHPFRQRPWDEIDAEFATWAETHSVFAHMSAIVKSVRSAGAEGDLAAFTSHHDLMVVAQPIREPPYDLVAVRTTYDGHIQIEHMTVTGRNDKSNVRRARQSLCSGAS